MAEWYPMVLGIRGAFIIGINFQVMAVTKI